MRSTVVTSFEELEAALNQSVRAQGYRWRSPELRARWTLRCWGRLVACVECGWVDEEVVRCLRELVEDALSAKAILSSRARTKRREGAA